MATNRLEKSTKVRGKKSVYTEKKHLQLSDIQRMYEWLEIEGNYEGLNGVEGKTEVGAGLKSKKQSWESLADYINRNQLKGSQLKALDWNSARNCYNYVHTKYKFLKGKAESTGWGLTEADEQAGMTNIGQKLEKLCPCYHRLDAIFGDDPCTNMKANLWHSNVSLDGMHAMPSFVASLNVPDDDDLEVLDSLPIPEDQHNVDWCPDYSPDFDVNIAADETPFTEYQPPTSIMEEQSPTPVQQATAADPVQRARTPTPMQFTTANATDPMQRARMPTPVQTSSADAADPLEHARMPLPRQFTTADAVDPMQHVRNSTPMQFLSADVARGNPKQRPKKHSGYPNKKPHTDNRQTITAAFTSTMDTLTEHKASLIGVKIDTNEIRRLCLEYERELRSERWEKDRAERQDRLERESKLAEAQLKQARDIEEARRQQEDKKLESDREQAQRQAKVDLIKESLHLKRSQAEIAELLKLLD